MRAVMRRPSSTLTKSPTKAASFLTLQAKVLAKFRTTWWAMKATPSSRNLIREWSSSRGRVPKLLRISNLLPPKRRRLILAPMGSSKKLSPCFQTKMIITGEPLPSLRQLASTDSPRSRKLFKRRDQATTKTCPTRTSTRTLSQLKMTVCTS